MSYDPVQKLEEVSAPELENAVEEHSLRFLNGLSLTKIEGNDKYRRRIMLQKQRFVAAYIYSSQFYKC